MMVIISLIANYYNQVTPKRSNHISHFLNSKYWEITGFVVSPPIYKHHKTRMLIQVDQLQYQQEKHDVYGMIRLNVRKNLSHFQPGWRTRFVAKIYPYSNFQNPGGFDYKNYMNYHKKIFGNAYPVKNHVDILEKSLPENFSSRRIYLAQHAVSKLIQENTSHETSGILHAMILGNRNYFPQSVRDAFIETGVSHLLAISGLHMGMIAMTAFVLFRWLFRRSEAICLMAWSDACAVIPAFLLMTLYFFLSGMSPSAQRAFMMISIFLFAQILLREHLPINTLFFAGSIILLLDFHALTTVSFQMSFCAVFFILLGFQRMPDRFLYISQYRLIQYLWNMFICSILAILATTPISLYYFYQTSWMGLLTNVFAVPLIGFLILPLALSSVVFFPFCKIIATKMIFISGITCDLLLYGIQFLSTYADIFSFRGHLNEFELFCWYACLTLCFCPYHSKRKYFWMILVFLLISDSAYWVQRRFFQKDLRISILDVGLGNAVLVELPGGKCMMIDGGGLLSSFDIGKSVVAPFLWQKKIKTVETIILTHPDRDHLQGLVFIARHFNTSVVWGNGDTKSTHLYEIWQSTLAEMEIPTVFMKEKVFHEEGNVLFQFFHPPGSSYFDDANNNSLVFQITFHGKKFLFTGDIEKDAESMLIQKYCNPIKSDLLLCPHHGSQTSSTKEFITCVQPKWVFISTSEKNRMHLPSPDVLERYRQFGCQQIFRTDLNGAIQIILSEKSVWIETFVSPE